MWKGLVKMNKIKKRKYSYINNPKICVALTAYNDEKSIFDAVQDYIMQPNVIEVIVVDNNSVDNTSVKALKAGARVVFEKNQGYGFACIRGLKEGLLNSEANIVVLSEGDGTFRGDDIKKFLAFLDNVDMVLGNRMTYQLVDDDSQQDLFFTWGNWFLAKLIQIKYINIKYFGKTRLMDVGCTFRAIRKESLMQIIDKLYVGKDHFSPHMMLVAISNELSIIEIPITFRKRVGISKGASGNKKRATRIGLQMMWHILTYRNR